MAKLDFGIWDKFSAYEMSLSPVAGDIYEQHIREVQLAENLGYKYYFIIEHQGSDVGQITSPSVYLCAVARATSSIRFGAMIYQMPFHHPVALAQETAMLDHLSKGRLEFGAGFGIHKHEFIRWGLPFEERREMSLESLDIVLKAWTEPSVTSKGKYWQLDEALTLPKPYQRPHPPVWIGAHSPPTIEYAARHNFNISQNLDIDEVIAEKFELYRRVWRSCGHQGPMPRTFLMRPVHVAETDEIARAEAEANLLMSDSLIGSEVAKTRIGFIGAPDRAVRGAEARGTREQRASYDWWIKNGIALIGSPETVIRQLEAQHKYIGYDLFCANHRFGLITTEQAVKSIKLFGEQVLPAFA